MKGVRVRREGWQGQCDYCRQWWPLTEEFWYPVQGLRRCRACLADLQRAKNVERRADPDYRAAESEATRLYRRANHERLLEYRRAYYASHREKILAARRARYSMENAEAKRKAYKRDWMRRHRADLRDEIAQGLAA